MTRTSRRASTGVRAGRLRWGLVFLAAAAACLPGCGGEDDPKTPQVTLRGRTWRVDLAMTQSRRYVGLSGRRELSPGTGMLFVYPDSAIREFCMRECYIPIDIAFLDADRRVVRMHTMQVEPDRLGRVAYSSDEPCQYALEVPAGELAEAGVQVGDVAEFSADVPSAAKAEPQRRR